MFTISDICNIAMQIECNGERTYREVGAITAFPHLVGLFENMANDEKRHADWFESIKLTEPISEEQRELEAMGRKLLQDMVKEQTFSLDRGSLFAEEDLDKLLEQFITFEQDTILFYEFLSELIEDRKTKAHLEMIIQEERRHIDHIREMVASVKERIEV